MHTARHKRSAPDPAFPKMLPASARAGCSQARRVHPAREVQLLHAPWARSGHLCSSKQPLPPWSSSLPSSFSLGFALEMEAASVWVPRAVAWSRVAWHGTAQHGTVPPLPVLWGGTVQHGATARPQCRQEQHQHHELPACCQHPDLPQSMPTPVRSAALGWQWPRRGCHYPAAPSDEPSAKSQTSWQTSPCPISEAKEIPLE